MPPFSAAWFRVADPRASAQITVRHLLNQTSSLPQLSGLRPWPISMTVPTPANDRRGHYQRWSSPARSARRGILQHELQPAGVDR